MGLWWGVGEYKGSIGFEMASVGQCEHIFVAVKLAVFEPNQITAEKELEL